MGDSDKLWGGRFTAPLDPAILDFTGSLPFDRRLVRHDLIGSLAHVRMLRETGVLEPGDAGILLQGLSELLADVEAGRLGVEGTDEDVHSWIERVLTERVGAVAGRVHTARSRNDQTAVALRLYVRESVRALTGELVALGRVLISTARQHVRTWMPGYTHLQRGQPISLCHHLLAHVWALVDDGDRLRAGFDRAGTSPLGAGALAGTPHPIDPHRSAELLGFPRVHPNSMLAVSDRDFVAEVAFACALVMLHLSRWADEIVLWTTREFGFATLADSVAQGSSLMPQKKNPEAAELIRGKSGRTVGNVAALLTMLKGLPLAYNSDLQEDKEPLFDSLDTTSAALRAASAVAAGIHYHPARMREALDAGFSTATDLADALVRRGVPFREAHGQAGEAVRRAEALGLELWELDPDALRECCPAADAEVLGSLEPDASAAARRSYGGPSPEAVEIQLEEAVAAVSRLEEWAVSQSPPPIYAAHLAGKLTQEKVG